MSRDLEVRYGMETVTVYLGTEEDLEGMPSLMGHDSEGWLSRFYVKYIVFPKWYDSSLMKALKDKL